MGLPAIAAEQQSHVSIKLVPERTDLPAGGAVFVLIEQQIEEGWHTYWVNPGDSGTAPRITWEMPEGFEAGAIRWPVPKRIDTAALTSYGYKGHATLIQEITAPFDIPEGPVTLKAGIDILVCNEICIPEHHEASITFNDGGEIENSELVNAALEEMPVDVNWSAVYRPADDGRLQIDLEFEQPALVTSGNAQVRMDIVPYDWGIIDNTAKTTATMYAKKKFRLFKKYDQKPAIERGPFKSLITFDVNNQKHGAIEVTAYPHPAWLAAMDKEKQAPEQPAPSAQQETKDQDQDTGLKKKLMNLLVKFYSP